MDVGQREVRPLLDGPERIGFGGRADGLDHRGDAAAEIRHRACGPFDEPERIGLDEPELDHARPMA